MDFQWGLLIDLGVISVALLVSTLIRAKVRFFDRYLIPNSLTAGFIMLFFYNFAAPAFGLTTINLENLVFHLLGISFVAMSLRVTPRRKGTHEVVGVSLVLLLQHILQAALGLGLTFLFIATMWPDLFPGFGLFLPLGFALGPGQSLAFGSKWEATGFAGAPSVGITFAAVGFLLACFIGVTLINIARKRGWLETGSAGANTQTGIDEMQNGKRSGMTLTTKSEAIDTLSVNGAVVLLCYLLTFLFLTQVTKLFALAGPMGVQFAQSLWVITYVFGGLTALLVKRLFILFGAEKIIDNGAMTRISGFSVDFLVAGSLGIISLVVVKEYWAPIVLIALGGVLITVFLHLWVSSRIFKKHIFDRTIMIFGAMTGTLPTGLALLRVVDPEFKTQVASDHMYAAGLMFPMAIPFILMVDFPANYFETGNPMWLTLTWIVLAAYVVAIVVGYRLIAGKRSFTRPGKLWFHREN